MRLVDVQGLRTLLVAQSKLPLAKYKEWHKKYSVAKNRQDYVDEFDKDKALDKIARDLEKGEYSAGMDLVGSTAIEVQSNALNALCTNVCAERTSSRRMLEIRFELCGKLGSKPGC